MAGDELAGLTLAGMVGVLISPVSWVHHIIWVFPAMVILTMRLVSSIRALADDNSGYASSDRALMVRIAQVIGYSVLMTAGLAIWCIPTASLMNVRDGDYDHAGALLAFAGSVQLIWLVIVLVVLPIERRSRPRAEPGSAGRRRRSATPTRRRKGPGVRAAQQGHPAAVSTGRAGATHGRAAAGAADPARAVTPPPRHTVCPRPSPEMCRATPTGYSSGSRARLQPRG